MFKRNIPLYLLTLVMVWTLAACSPSTPSPATPLPQGQPTQAATQEDSSAYPLSLPTDEVNPAYPDNSGYPAPLEVAPQGNINLPTQDATLGSLKGSILESGKPVSNITLYLASVIKNSDGKEMVVRYYRESSPSAETDAQGKFEFRNLQPGRYGLILDTVVNAYLLYYPGEKQSEILETVEAGKTADVGELNYDDVPGN